MRRLVETSKSGLYLALTIVAGCAVAAPPCLAAEDVLPDLALLEYLGSWEDTDEDWVLLNDEKQHTGQEETEGDPVAEDEELQESDDER